MSPLDLSVPASRAWRLCLPEDFLGDIPDDATDIPAGIASWFNGSHPADEVVILVSNSDYQFSRTQGMMILCWLSDSPAPIAAAIKNQSIAAVTEVLVQGAIAMRLARGILAKNADVILSLNRGTLHVPDDALVPQMPVVPSDPKPASSGPEIGR